MCKFFVHSQWVFFSTEEKEMALLIIVRYPLSPAETAPVLPNPTYLSEEILEIASHFHGGVRYIQHGPIPPRVELLWYDTATRTVTDRCGCIVNIAAPVMREPLLETADIIVRP